MTIKSLWKFYQILYYKRSHQSSFEIIYFVAICCYFDFMSIFAFYCLSICPFLPLLACSILFTSVSLCAKNVKN